MGYPVVVPAVAIIVGVVVGSFVSLPADNVRMSVLVLIWAAAVLAFFRRRTVAFVVAVTVGFAIAACTLAVRATRDALHSPLRVLFDAALTAEAASDGPFDFRDHTLLMTIQGRLREDAAASASGVSLSLAVEQVVRADGTMVLARGGVLATASGPLAARRQGEWRAGRTLRLPIRLRRPARYMNPGVPDFELGLARRGTCLVGSVKSALLVDTVAAGGWLAELAAEARASARAAIGEAVGRWDDQSRAIVTAILIGDRTGLADEVERRLQQAGTYHVIAISGGNIAILAGLILGALGLVGLGARPATFCAIVLLIGYAAIVGGGPSVNRATLMAVIYLAARLIDHRGAPGNALAVAAAILLCAAPLSIFDVGFALSFGATFAILVAVPRVLASVPRLLWVRAPIALFAASLAAEAALFPIGASAFSRVTFAGLVLNFVAIPLMTAVQVAGLSALALAGVHERGAQAAGFIAYVAAMGIVETARLVDVAPWLTYRLPPPAPAAIVLYYLGWTAWIAILPGGVLHHTRLRAWPLARVAAGGLVAASAIWILTAPVRAWPGGQPRDRLRVTFLDVGQGDAALVQFPNGRTLLVDTGGIRAGGGFDIGARVVAPALWALGVRRLDYLAVTHAHPDHAGGAPSIVRDFPPHELWEGVPVPGYPPLGALADQAAAAAAGWRTLQTGDRLQIGKTEVLVWYPPLPDWERQRVRNDDSLVIEVRLGGVAILLTGDIEGEAERDLSPRLAPADLRILKVPHHGSRTSSSIAFITASNPAVAVFSAGRGNPFGHPVPEVLRRYDEAGAFIFRTDRDGAVSVETDGRQVNVRSWTGRTLVLRSGE